MYTIEFSSLFERDLKSYERHGGDIRRVHAVIDMLRQGKDLPVGLRDHQLKGKLHIYRELHVEGDRLLVYQKDGKQLRIVCLWLVTHQKLRARERSS